jgi:hypothetical protein
MKAKFPGNLQSVKNSTSLQKKTYSPLEIGNSLDTITRELFIHESTTRQQEVFAEVLAFYENGHNDVLFSIADQVLSKSIAEDVEYHLKKLVTYFEEGSINEFSFKFEIVQPIVNFAHKTISDLESKHSADLTEVLRILKNPDYEESIAKLIKEKLDKYIKLFKARDLDIVEVYSSNTNHSIGTDYENYVGITFERAGWIILKTPVTGDQGADLICTISGLKLVVQCKFYSGNVGNAAVQEVYAAKDFYEASLAVVVSNAGFTRSAIELADKLSILLVSDEKLEQFARTPI